MRVSQEDLFASEVETLSRLLRCAQLFGALGNEEASTACLELAERQLDRVDATEPEDEDNK